MIVSGFRGAARALPQGQRATHSRAAAVTACAPSIPLGRAPSGHQRRPSSSKASCPPGDQSGNPRTTTAPAKASTTESSAAKSAPPRTGSGRSSNGRAGRGRKSKDEAWGTPVTSDASKSNSWFDSLPSVPNTNAISEADLKLSSLFALHRPLALGAPVPPITPQHAFDKLFEPSTSQKPHPADVVATLQSTISALESQIAPQSSDLRWNVVQESPSNSPSNVHHLDGRPRRAASVEEFVAQLKPYMKPAPPLPASTQPQQKSRKPRKGAQNDSGKQEYTATMILRQVEGQDYMTGELQSLEPIMRERMTNIAQKMRGGRPQPQQQSAAPQMSPNKKRGMMMSFGKRVKMRKVMQIMGDRYQTRFVAVRARGPYVRMRRARKEAPSGAGERGVVGERAGGEGMHAISVKRQRKLKMKKHKYKKLMKRTRNLRRRLDK
ncbi:hypothetical protein B9Z65_5846 [Elsinoe australis]|uniref:Small ribosomal subunit protein mS38 n=1 Tax=Elsinoe australis TaxID=40998 RepID=A0A2P7YJ78_9PEZI|nr:hypothetical protein B9Z65_5846 [Elsinoe australis]